MSSAQNIASSLSPSGIAPTPQASTTTPGNRCSKTNGFVEQNTPAAHLSHSVLSRPQVPSTLSEEAEEEDDIPVISTAGANAGLAGLASNPAFAALVQGRLTSLVGRSSGYVESLPAPVRRRVTGLKGVQAEHTKIEAEFQKDIFELEKKYALKYAPLYERRRALIEGQDEPSPAEIESGEKAEDESDDEDFDESDEDDEPKPKVRIPTPTADEIAQAPKGVPEFWLTALKNHLGLSELITERDEEALKFLVDIRLEYPADKPGFTLVFHFSEPAKAFFANTKLEKTYYYQDEVGYEGDFVYDHAIGTKINWVEGKDLTTRIETKKQRNKNTNQTRIVKKAVPTDSFFSFFSPPSPPDEDDEDEDEDIDEKLELDYQIGEDLKERVIPRAIDFFTGKALRYEQANQEDFDSDDEFDEEDDDEDDDDDDDEPRGGARKAPAPPSGNTPASHQDPQECKQQ